MAFLGKFLVFVHMGLSLCFASWALALYTNRIDYKGKDAGEHTLRKAEYDKSVGPLRAADLRWRNARVALVNEERWRPYEKAWYAQQIAFLRTGATEANPARQVVLKDGLPVLVNNPKQGELLQMGPLLDQEGKPRVGLDNQPLKLQSLAYYVRAVDDTFRQIEGENKRLATAAREDQKWTAELNGTAGKRGLHTQLHDEHAKKDQIEKEYRELRPQWLNAMVELQNLKELTGRLQERKNELVGNAQGKGN